MPPFSLTPEASDELEALLQLLKATRGFDFTGYKRASLARRISARMDQVGCRSFAEYADYLEVHQGEFAPLFNTILINVTAFFRDESTWQFIAEEVIPRILEQKDDGEQVRVWSAGCASGEEPYTLAMLLAEAMGIEGFRQRVKIYATDPDDEALETARRASYPERVMSAVPEELRAKYFERTDAEWIFRKDLRRQMIFGRHDLIQDAPISRVDLLSCRNTLMYFNAETQARILDRFRFALNDHGFLVLGRAETLLSLSNAFQPIDVKRRISMKVARGDGLRRGGSSPRSEPERESAMEDRQSHALRAGLDAAPVATVVVDHEDTLIVANERARALFALAHGDVGRRLQDLRLSYRPVQLRSLIEQVRSDRRTVVLREVAWHGLPTSEPRWFDLELTPLVELRSSAVGVAITFTDVTAAKRLQLELEHSHQELETAYEELQSTNEELETTNEELQSTIEELETTNEELQSTNEEMETMNEELQSTNEELEATNGELSRRGNEMSDLNAFLQSILSSLNASVIVVDSDFEVRAWNRRSEDLWGLRQDEVVGRHVLNLDVGLPLDQLRGPIRDTLVGTPPTEDMTLRAINRRGREILVRARLTRLEGGFERRGGAIIAIDVVESPSGDGVHRREALDAVREPES